MPLIAEDKQTQNKICILDFNNPRTEIRKGSISCPFCKQDMIVVAGLIKQHHFRHLTKCESSHERHVESQEHIESKVYIANTVKEMYEEFSFATYEYEVLIPQANRIADILFTFPLGWQVAFEVQLSSITTEQLDQRTRDYASAGIDIYWFLGKSANTKANREWVYKHQYECYILQFPKDNTDWDEHFKRME